MLCVKKKNETCMYKLNIVRKIFPFVGNFFFYLEKSLLDVSTW